MDMSGVIAAPRVVARAILEAGRLVREQRRAERDYRALCRQNRGPNLFIDLHIHSDDPEWTNLHGLAGVKTTVQLNRRGERFIAGCVRDIRATCVRELILINRETPDAPGRAGETQEGSP